MTATRNLAFFAPVLIVSSSCQTRLVPSGVNETAPFVHQLNPDPLQSYPALVSEPSTNMIIEEEAPPTFDLPALSKDPLVQKWIRYFLSDGKERFQRYLNRGLPYRPAILTMFKKENLPAELFFVPLIESGFSLKARSHAGAAGPWQASNVFNNLLGTTHSGVVRDTNGCTTTFSSNITRSQVSASVSGAKFW